MSIGLIALLDDVAALAKVAAASLDDVAGQAARAGVKAAGVVIDDAAVTPRYVVGFSPAREIPIVWRIARGSLRNKLLGKGDRLPDEHRGASYRVGGANSTIIDGPSTLPSSSASLASQPTRGR